MGLPDRHDGPLVPAAQISAANAPYEPAAASVHRDVHDLATGRVLVVQIRVARRVLADEPDAAVDRILRRGEVVAEAIPRQRRLTLDDDLGRLDGAAGAHAA